MALLKASLHTEPHSKEWHRGQAKDQKPGNACFVLPESSAVFQAEAYQNQEPYVACSVCASSADFQGALLQSFACSVLHHSAGVKIDTR